MTAPRQRATLPPRVLGTAIEAARDDDRARLLLLSDLHVPAGGGRVVDDLAAVLEDAARGGGAAAARVMILGDLFDAFVGPRQLAVGVWAHVVELLRSASGRGVSVSVVPGNRDFMLDAAFARAAACRVVAGGLSFKLGDRRALALHGDELCTNDLPYQRAKRWLRHPLTRALLRRVPLRVALGLAERARRKSRRTVMAGDQRRFAPPAAALRAAFATGADLLVFGHIHRPARGAFEGGAEYCVLPAFDAGGVCLEHACGELWYRDASGRRLPDPAPREFM